MNNPQEYSLPGWGTGPEGVVVYIRIRNTQLNVSINTDDFRRSPKSLAKFLSNKAKFVSDTREDDADSFEYCEEVAALFLPTLRVLAPPVDCSAQLTLADLSLRFAYTAHVEYYDEQPNPSTVTQADPEEQDGSDSDHFNIAPKTWPFPRFNSSDVKVHVDGDPAFISTFPRRGCR